MQAQELLTQKFTKPKKKIFEKVINNLKMASQFKRENGIKCTLGVQTLLLPENKHEIIDLVKL